jgi:hypothetical protein
MNILVVEDEPELASVLVRGLEEECFCVQLCGKPWRSTSKRIAFMCHQCTPDNLRSWFSIVARNPVHNPRYPATIVFARLN